MLERKNFEIKTPFTNVDDEYKIEITSYSESDQPAVTRARTAILSLSSQKIINGIRFCGTVKDLTSFLQAFKDTDLKPSEEGQPSLKEVLITELEQKAAGKMNKPIPEGQGAGSPGLR